MKQHDAADHGRHCQHDVDAEKEQQRKERSRDGSEKRIAVDVGAGGGEHRGEHQRLHHHLRVGIPGEPDLDDVQREETGAGERRRFAEQPCAGEVHREHAEDRPHADRLASAREAVEAVADRDRRRVEVRELADHRARRRILDEEPHEADAVVRLAGVLREEQIARERRHGRDRVVLHDERAALRDLDAGVHVHTGILSADHIFGRREKAPGSEGDERNRKGDRPSGARRGAPETQPESRHNGDDDGDGAVGEQQTSKAVTMCGGERQHDRERQRDTEDDLPERALFDRERRAAIARGTRRPEDDRAGDPRHDQ